MEAAGFRIVELSHSLVPDQEEYRLSVTNRFVEELLPFYTGKRPDDAWYIMSEIEAWSHVGTHLESPFHYLRDGVDVAGLELDRCVGLASLIDMSDKAVGEAIRLEELQERGRHVQQGDIVLVRTDHGHYGTPRSHDRPHFAEEAIEWLAVDLRIRMLGVDCSGIERRDQPRQPNHLMLFRHGIPLIEHLANLDLLRRPRFLLVAVPWRVRGLDASPVSVIALEPNG